MTPAAAKAKCLRLMASRGESVKIVRDDFNTGSSFCVVRAVVTGLSPEELASGIDVGTRKLIVYADDVTFDKPLKEGDQVVLRDGTPAKKTLSIEDVDDSTSRLGGVLITYHLTASGRK